MCFVFESPIKQFKNFVIIKYQMKNDSRNKEEKVRSTGPNFYNEQKPISQIELEQKCVHLQTLLILTQLNSAYFQLHISLVKVLSNLEHKYFGVKMNAFLKLKNHKQNQYQAKFIHNLKNCMKASHVNFQINSSGQQKDLNTALKVKIRQPGIIWQDAEDTKNIALIQTRQIIQKIVKRIHNKIQNRICSAFYKILKYHKDPSLLKIFSGKPSQTETIDNQKVEISKSREKRQGRRLYSYEKSKYISRNGHNHAKEETQPAQIQGRTSLTDNQSQNYTKNVSDLNRLLQKNAETVANERRNRFVSSRQKRTLRIESNKREVTSVIITQKQQKILELEFLKKKYTKLITEFNKFSQKFIKVIQQQQAK